jgi:ABC-2 type transport system ATP-binding protein
VASRVCHETGTGEQGELDHHVMDCTSPSQQRGERSAGLRVPSGEALYVRNHEATQSPCTRNIPEQRGLRVIRAEGLTKRYGSTVAVDHLDFEVQPGVVTGFLGPNGAGKTTTMRLILGLDSPTSGQVTVNGRFYGDVPYPLHEVGALLDAKALHPSRSAYNHLLALAKSSRISRARVDVVLDLVGLSDVAGRPAGKFSLGMGQRLGIAAALLGDPPILMFDEPVNGLDPEGILWIRTLLKSLATEGRTIFLSSHLMSEMAQTADQLIVVGRGRLIVADSVANVIGSGQGTVRVETSRLDDLYQILAAKGGSISRLNDALVVSGLDSRTIGELALEHRIVVSELVRQRESLEDAYFRLTEASVDFHGSNSLVSGDSQ